MLPFSSKLEFLRVTVSTFTSSIQIGFFIGISFACILFIIVMINLMLDYKTRILEARKGIFRDFNMDAIGVADAANFPGLVISNSIASFVFVTLIVTIIFAILSFPLFWLFLWSQYTYFIAILVSMWLNDLIDGYLTDFAYDD